MSFVVKYRTTTAGGRTILRPHRFDKEELVIGRGGDCEVSISDLGVTLHHAHVRRLSERMIEFESRSEKSLPFIVNGRRTSSAEVRIDRGATLRFGDHIVTVEQGEGDEEGDAILVVERVAPEPETIDSASLFSLKGRVPGKRISAWGFVLLILAAFLAWPIWSYYDTRAEGERGEAFHADEMWISGPLSAAHANLQNNCTACHQEPFVAVQDRACLACHVDTSDHAPDARMARAEAAPGAWRGLLLGVGNAFNVPRRSCASCHIEHEGSGEMAAAPQQFCADCHSDLDARMTDTRLLDAHDFAGGHPEFRPRIMATPGTIENPAARFRRVSLADDPRENTGLKFPHDLHLSTANGVARMAQRLGTRYGFEGSLDCANCHIPTADGTRFEPISMEANCQMCHSLAFDRIGGTVRTLRHGEPEMVVADIRAFYRSTGATRPIDLSGMARRRPGDDNRARTVGRYQFAERTRYGRADNAIRAVFSEGGACFDCHRVERSASAQAPFAVKPVRQIGRYMQLGWFDHAAHATEDCTTCHAANRSDASSDVLLPGIATCRECHSGAAPHGDRVTSSCALCHSYHQDDGAPYLVRARNRRGQRPETVRDYRGLTINPASR